MVVVATVAQLGGHRYWLPRLGPINGLFGAAAIIEALTYDLLGC